MSAIQVQTTTPRQSPARFARKYGPAFNRFDGPIHIDCRFRHSKTQLGVLGTAQNQAGILYVDLTFSQPKDCPLTSAVVWISLEEEDKDWKKEHKFRKRRTKSTPMNSSRNDLDPFEIAKPRYGKSRFLQFTHDFGPKQLEGRPTNMTTKSVMHLTPEVNVLGNGGGGLGYDREQTFTQASRWMFTGNLLPGSRLLANPENINYSRAMVYRTLKWELSKDDLQRQSTHSSEIQTAFTFEHDMEPFYIRVEIQGKLKRNSKHLRSNVKQLFKFHSDNQKEVGKSMILVIPDKERKLTRRLDPIAKVLPFQMERLNLEGIRVQFPDSLPVSYQDAPQVAQYLSAESETAVEEGYSCTDPVDSTKGKQSSLPAYKSPEILPSSLVPQPIVQPIPRGLWSIKESPIVAQEPVLISLKDKISVPSHVQPHSSMDSTQIGENGVLPTSQNSKLKPDHLSSRVTSLTQNPSEKELNELAAQIAQFPVLVLIFEWVIYVVTFLPV
ncbi:hypothetical protein LT330_007245 [Penicillium expansum]|nr:hypothetical protein LT330_007245 [Penicillium expansum]